MSADITVVNAADLHLEATHHGGWSHEHGVHENWIESFRQLDNVISTCNEVEADFLNIAGDMYDTGRPPAEAVARTLEAFRNLNPHTKVIFQLGNHDRQTVVGQHRTPIEAYLADQPWCHAVQSEPGVIEIDGFKIAGAPWLKVAGSSQLEAAQASLEDQIRQMMDEVGEGPSMFAGHVVLAECTFDSGRRGSEMTMTTTALEASVPTAVIDEGPWAVARLGHIHKRQQLSAKTGYTGSTYKVSFGETNDAKGVDVVRFDAKGGATVEFREFSVRELIKSDISDEGGESPTIAAERAQKGDIVRFIMDADTEPKGFDKVLRKLERGGVKVQMIRKPKPRSEVVTRTRGLETDIDPDTALRVYMDKQGVTPEKREALLREYADLTA